MASRKLIKRLCLRSDGYLVKSESSKDVKCIRESLNDTVIVTVSIKCKDYIQSVIKRLSNDFVSFQLCLLDQVGVHGTYYLEATKKKSSIKNSTQTHPSMVSREKIKKIPVEISARAPDPMMDHSVFCIEASPTSLSILNQSTRFTCNIDKVNIDIAGCIQSLINYSRFFKFIKKISIVIEFSE